ncbi:hypothetical protein TSUD_66070 [Trifolium subterraneum]|uniref:Ubiquinol oxidase n=1 Tax=Trifolium subterraneum TaxID=3900 RepID=A0A2Z6MP66_TRISU|nr:hypothetical protein TSUD_66070 [Trifolium subterraneum]
MMKHSALCYVIRRTLIGGRNCNRYSSAVVRPFMAEEMRQRKFVADGGNGGFFYWKRMMASKAASETEVKSTEKEKKEESSGKKNNVVVSSYWGISRPKITREDGTEWPWNCFMGVFFNAFFVVYILSPKLAHRVVGYLEEEAVHSYTEYLKDIESGAVENVPAPAIAIDYWRLPKDAKLKDVITVIRADEAHHRDVNHFASITTKKDADVVEDIHFHGKELRDAPAPLGYH